MSFHGVDGHSDPGFLDRLFGHAVDGTRLDKDAALVTAGLG